MSSLLPAIVLLSLSQQTPPGVIPANPPTWGGDPVNRNPSSGPDCDRLITPNPQTDIPFLDFTGVAWTEEDEVQEYETDDCDDCFGNDDKTLFYTGPNPAKSRKILEDSGVVHVKQIFDGGTRDPTYWTSTVDFYPVPRKDYAQPYACHQTPPDDADGSAGPGAAGTPSPGGTGGGDYCERGPLFSYLKYAYLQRFTRRMVRVQTGNNPAGHPTYEWRNCGACGDAGRSPPCWVLLPRRSSPGRSTSRTSRN